MLLDLTSEEKEFLEQLLQNIHSDVLHQIHHSDIRAYKKLLQGQSEIIESIQKKLSVKSSSVVIEFGAK